MTCGHSFHAWVAPILEDLAKGAGIQGHHITGMAMVGGSAGVPPYLTHHWNMPDESNPVKQALRTGQVDVLTLSPIWLPDPAIEKFTQLALAHNPDTRLTVQAYWLPNDTYDTSYPLAARKPVDHDQTQIGPLREAHVPYFKSVEDNVKSANDGLAKPAVFVVPVGQAVLELRQMIVDGKLPALPHQWDLFQDTWGHPLAPIQLVTAYCHFAVIYKQSPVGLPVPAESSMPPHWPAKRPWRDEALNRVLQELSWNAVKAHPQSGI